jgi:hypothetical protein
MVLMKKGEERMQDEEGIASTLRATRHSAFSINRWK